MVDTKIKDLTAKTPVVSTDEFIINDAAGGNLDKKVDAVDIKNYVRDGSVANTIVKQADETVTSSTTMQDDDELYFPVAANTVYAGHVFVHITSNSTANFKYEFSKPTGATEYYGISTWLASGSAVGTNSGVGQAVTIGNTNRLTIVIQFIVDVGGTAGDFKFRWAQNTSDGVNTIVKKGSSMVYYK